MCYCLLESHTEEKLRNCFANQIKPTRVPTVLHPPHPAPEIGTRVKPPSVQVLPKHTRHILSNSFLYIFQIVRPNVRSLGPLRPQSTNEYDMHDLSNIRTRTL